MVKLQASVHFPPNPSAFIPLTTVHTLFTQIWFFNIQWLRSTACWWIQTVRSDSRARAHLRHHMTYKRSCPGVAELRMMDRALPKDWGIHTGPWAGPRWSETQTVEKRCKNMSTQVFPSTYGPRTWAFWVMTLDSDASLKTVELLDGPCPFWTSFGPGLNPGHSPSERISRALSHRSVLTNFLNTLRKMR